jgi:hypothetical protein
MAALGIARTAFDSWVVRGYLDLPKGPGTGRSRQMTFWEVVRTATLAEMVRNRIPPKEAAELLRSVDKEFRDALSDHDGGGYVMMFEETKARIDNLSFLQAWVTSWIYPDQEYPRIDPNAPIPQQEGFQKIETVRSLGHIYGEIGHDSGRTRTDALARGRRPLFVSALHIGNLVWRVRKALNALDADA